jgi:putative endonuclease
LNKRKIGKEKEELACDILRKKGYQILAVNYFCRGAELDIVAKDGECLVFLEVKYRSSAQCGGSRYAVSAKKIQHIVKGARYYLYREKVPPDTQIRFDVMAMEKNATGSHQIWHYENAFDATGYKY